jgi:hypothetical protein
MNGRMYDPLVGRMLSPDPFIQAPGSTQGLNRYSYCFNNPLKYTDPSGYNILETFVNILTAPARMMATANNTLNAALGFEELRSYGMSGDYIWGANRPSPTGQVVFQQTYDPFGMSQFDMSWAALGSFQATINAEFTTYSSLEKSTFNQEFTFNVGSHLYGPGDPLTGAVSGAIAPHINPFTKTQTPRTLPGNSTPQGGGISPVYPELLIIPAFRIFRWISNAVETSSSIDKTIHHFEISENGMSPVYGALSKPKPSPNFIEPTNTPQAPPSVAPPGYKIRVMRPTEQYENGYWTLLKPCRNGGMERINPTTMKPGQMNETHIPLPQGWWNKYF